MADGKNDVPEPRPDVAPILLIHRGEDGYVTFHQKGKPYQGGTRPWIDLGGISVSELESIFPQFARSLIEDSYFSINSMYGAGACYEQLKDGSRVPFVHSTGLRPCKRGERFARYLNACYIDLDCHDGDFDFPSMFGKILRLQDVGAIPPASVVARSGRGLWLFWLLEDEKNPGYPQRAWPEKVELYGRIQRTFALALKDAGADLAARDVARVCRVPGSVNTVAEAHNRLVRYWVQKDGDGRTFLYTLPQLAAWFGLAARKTQTLPSTSRPSDPKRRGGWVASWRNRWEDFCSLYALRGGFDKGHRHDALLLLVLLGSKVGLQRGELEERACVMGAECSPPIAPSECIRSVRTVLEWAKKNRGRYISHAKCAEMLGVTPEEYPLLKHWRPKQEKVGKRPSDSRRECIGAVVGELGYVPSLAEMKRQLGERGITISRPQVSLDYAALGIRSEARRGRKPSSRSSAEPLPSIPPHYSSEELDNSELQRGQAQLARRQRITELVSSLAVVPTVREMAELLTPEGFEVGRMTVSNDYHALGIGKRRAKRQEMPLLFGSERRAGEATAIAMEVC